MTIVNCPNCKAKLQAKGDLEGKKIKCPTCGQLFSPNAPQPPSQASNSEPILALPPPLDATTDKAKSPIKDRLKQRLAELSPTQKKVGAISALAATVLLATCCCSGSSWLSYNSGVDAGKKQAVVELQKKLADAIGAFGKIPEHDEPAKKVAVANWLQPDKTFTQDGISFELLSGTIGKLQIKNSFGSGGATYSSEEVLQIKFRVTNRKDNFIFEYHSWSNGSNGQSVIDEHDNIYRPQYHQGIVDVVGSTRYKRVDPGQSVDDVLAFDLPLVTSKEFRLQLPGARLKLGTTIAYKIPRSFFEVKN